MITERSEQVKLSELCHILERLVRQTPELSCDVERLIHLIRTEWDGRILANDLNRYLNHHGKLREGINRFLAANSKSPEQIYPVHKPYSDVIRQRMKLAEENDHYRNWANAIRSVPEFTLPIPIVDGKYIRNARDIWQQYVCGNDAVLETLLRHSIEYSKTGKTTPILLVGEPGAGKTLIAKTYSRILNLPGSFISGPSASMGRGLSGAPNLYTGAGTGAVVQSMIDHKAGNPVICIDEIEKTAKGHSGQADFQNELLAVLDDSNVAWYDNFLEIEVDASHIPFIFTANEKDLISSPLLDRLEIIQIESPTLEMLQDIARDYTLPRIMKSYNCERIIFRDAELEMMVNMLWENGGRSCRTYQKAIELLVSSAYLDVIENDRTVTIAEKDIGNAVDKCSLSKRSRSIGFRL